MRKILRSIIIPFSIAVILGSCFSDNRNIRFTFDNLEISESGTEISLSRAPGGEFDAYLMSRGERVVLGWRTRYKNPEKWTGDRYRAHRFKVKTTSGNFSFNKEEIGILIEITDVSGQVVSGKFSGRAGIGAGSHNISNGTFRAPVYFWDR